MKLNLRGRVIILFDDVDIETAAYRYETVSASLQEKLWLLAEEVVNRKYPSGNIERKTANMTKDSARLTFFVEVHRADIDYD